MTVLFSTPNMGIQFTNQSSPTPPPLKALAFSKKIFINPFRIASNPRHKHSFLAIKARHSESEQPQNLASKEAQPKRMVWPVVPEIDNFKEPEPTKESLKFMEAKEKVTSMDYQQVLKYPLVTESAMKQMIEHNTLVFMVDVRADKKDIRNAFEKMLSIKTKRINTLINYDGTKKAYIQLAPENQAVAFAKKMKILA